MSENDGSDRRPDDLPAFAYRRDDAGRIIVSGEIDLETAEAFRPMLLASHDPIELDLAGVSFIDSSGIRVLYRAKQVRSVRIVAASPAVSRVIEMLGVAGDFGM